MNKADYQSRNVKRRYVDHSIDGVAYRFQSLTSREMNSWIASQLNMKGEATPGLAIGRKERLLMRMLVDENDTRVYTDDDAKLIEDWDDPIVDELFDVAQEHAKKPTAETTEKN